MTCRPDSFMSIGFMGPMSPNTATVSTPTNCCLIPMPGDLPDGWYGAMRISPIGPGAHAKGLTQKRSDVPPNLRGTYGGLSSRAMIEHLKRLGVTTIELLPVHGLVDDRMLVEKKLSNYWGYNTLSFFAPEPRYSQDNPLDAFRTTVARLHDAGIEVMLDVVYNHTAEGNHLGPTLSFRGIDNASYYWLKPDNPRFYDDFTGCGSSVNLTHPRVLQMVMDSLRYWVEVCHVDGFRFDLATTLARGV